MITLRQLRYFEAVSRHLHFGRAAEECAVTQPALSQQVQEMEAILGVPLLERGPRRIALTPKGEAVARRAIRILGDVRDLMDYAQHGGALLAGPLKLGVIPSIAPYLLPKVLPLVQARYPQLELHLRETLTTALVDELLQGKLDVVLMALPVSDTSLESEALFVDRFLLASQSGPALDSAAVASPEMIPPDRLLLLEEGHCLRDQALTYCRIPRSGMLNGFGAASLSTIMQMVANGYGVTLLPEICVDIEARDKRIALTRFASPEPQREIGLVWRRSSPRRGDFAALGELLVEGMSRPADLLHPAAKAVAG
ncbi:LysR substrate-binding domain-containing protein [Kaistia dalseonensis]|uniref:LysR family hydrogen peroxide-inducible transcriptional activator n=1 Tax=Kaistia dalseonensis TaxID=410840 RepID=A0ABU0HBW9_9HYPH|nr:hydrogen peroxide-inducible genes activator [Kaistia dalseonensis]MCX5497172.1 LysR substrate-binding domain-containing protein [Kaistia dalseonensis]MDQ0439803.1 LysR family hydrogen peroxide-inducible transcriptional activator [Kaistia dalseonensis]